MPANNYEHIIGKRFKLKASITTPPQYLNTEDMVKYLFTNRKSFVVDDVRKNVQMGWIVFFNYSKYIHWAVRLDDIEPEAIDNRRVS